MSKITNLLFSHRIAAIKCILSVEQVHDDADESDIVFRHQIANVVFLVLPKVISTLINVATGDETLGEALIAVINTQLNN